MVQLDENMALTIETLFFRVLFYLLAGIAAILIYKQGKKLEDSASIGGNSWAYLALGFIIIGGRMTLGVIIRSLDSINQESLIDILSLLRYSGGIIAAAFLFYGYYRFYITIKSVYGD